MDERKKIITKFIEQLQEECDHDFEIYCAPIEPQRSSIDIEQAGYCRKCGYDTHGKFHELFGTEKGTFGG